MKTFFKNRKLNKLLKIKGHTAYKGLNNSTRVLILFKNETPNKTSMVLQLEKLIKKYSNIQLHYLGYVDQKLKKEEQPIPHYFYKNDLDWLNLPKLGVVEELTAQTFDVVIDLDEDEQTPNTFILLRVKAGLRVGFTKVKDIYDFVMHKGSANEQEIINQLEHYLNNIEKK